MWPTQYKCDNMVMTRAVASGVKGGDYFRGPRLRGPAGDLNRPGDLNRQPKKTLRTVDGPLLRFIKKAYHLHVFLSLANLNIQKSLKHSKTRRGKAQTSARAPCSVHTQRAASHRKQDQT